jgi:hypothetical protein
MLLILMCCETNIKLKIHENYLCGWCKAEFHEDRPFY